MAEDFAPFPQLADKRIANRFIKESFSRGYTISVWDGEEITLVKSAKREEIIAAMCTTDMDNLHVYEGDNLIGTAAFIYGNEPGVVIADWTTGPKMEEIMADVSAYATTQEE
jgi:hypothetical protein